jgi:hypothetical protein
MGRSHKPLAALWDDEHGDARLGREKQLAISISTYTANRVTECDILLLFS